MQFKVKNVNQEAGEISGIYVAVQASDTDMGSKAPREILTKGIWFAKLGNERNSV